MALAVSRLAKVAGGGSASYNFGSVTVTAGALLVVGITSRSRAAQTVSSVQTTADTSGWSSTAVVADGNGNFTQLWYKLNVTGGTSQACTVTFSASISDAQITLAQITGADTTASAYITENSGTATSLSTVTSGSMTLPTRECVIFAAAVTTNDRSWTPDNGATELYDSFVEDAAGSGQTHYRIVSGGGSFTAGSTASSSFGFAAIGTLVIGSPAGPSITANPTDQTVNAGSTATFSVTASGGTAPLTYQARKDGSNISGATSANYTTPPVAYADQGAAFDFVVTDAGALTATSSAARLIVAYNLAGTIKVSAVPAAFGAGPFGGPVSAPASSGVGYSLSAAAGVYAAAGQVAAVQAGRRLAAASGVLAQSGQAAGLARSGVARTLAADAGAYATAGQAAGARVARVVAAASAIYAGAGQLAGLRAARRVLAIMGGYALAGQSAGVRAGRRFIAAPGAFALGGQSAGARAARAVAAIAGSHAVAGQAVGLTYSAGPRAVTAAQGGYAYAGQTAGLRVARRASANAGAYGLAGQVVGLSKTAARQVAADVGIYALGGRAAGLLAMRRLLSDAGAYVHGGRAAGLSQGTGGAAPVLAWRAARELSAGARGNQLAAGSRPRELSTGKRGR